MTFVARFLDRTVDKPEEPRYRDPPLATNLEGSRNVSGGGQAIGRRGTDTELLRSPGEESGGRVLGARRVGVSRWDSNSIIDSAFT